MCPAKSRMVKPFSIPKGPAECISLRHPPPSITQVVGALANIPAKETTDLPDTDDVYEGEAKTAPKPLANSCAVVGTHSSKRGRNYIKRPSITGHSSSFYPTPSTSTNYTCKSQAEAPAAAAALPSSPAATSSPLKVLQPSNKQPTVPTAAAWGSAGAEAMSWFDRDRSTAVLLMEKRIAQLQQQLMDSREVQSQHAATLLQQEQQHAKQLQDAQVCYHSSATKVLDMYRGCYTAMWSAWHGLNP